MNIRRVFKSPSQRAKVLGTILIIVGISVIILKNEEVFLNVGFGAIFIGLFAIMVIKEKTVPKRISDAQMQSNLQILSSISENLDLKGNGVYIPQGGSLTKERVFIPVSQEEKYNLPAIDDETVFVAGTSGSSLGVMFTPPGLGLLELYENDMEIDIKNIEVDELEQNLQIMIYNFGLIKDLSIKKEDNLIKVKITKPIYYELVKEKKMEKIYKQTGDPAVSSILCAITRSSGKKIRIQSLEIKDNVFKYTLKVEG
jgi:hypothetical protein